MSVALDSLNDLPGWASDSLGAALAAMGVFTADPKSWIIEHYRCGETIPADFTGYYEPVLNAARCKDHRFRFPIHRLPDGGAPNLPRAELAATGHLSGSEMAWLDDPLEAFLLQVQGSGRLRFSDGTTMRVGYAGSNGQPYISIGKLLVARDVIPAQTISIAAIRTYGAAHPEALLDLLNENPSYVFFREMTGLPETAGPVGTAGISLTAMHSVAVDPAFIPLGTPIWIEADGTDPIRRLVLAQDTGSAIKGAGRIDLFFGTGDAAGARAGAFRCAGRITPLVRRDEVAE